MAFKVGTGVISPAFGTGTVMESNDDKTKVRFDKDDAEKTLLNQYLRPSQHELKIMVKPMETIELTLDDLFQLERLPLKRRADCWISFSVNAGNDIWNFVTRGWTKRRKAQLHPRPVPSHRTNRRTLSIREIRRRSCFLNERRGKI